MELTLTEREQILERAIKKVEARGYILKSSTQTTAILVPAHRKKNIASDSCLTVAFLGFWIIPAAIAAATGQHSKVTIHVYTDGTVHAKGTAPLNM